MAGPAGNIKPFKPCADTMPLCAVIQSENGDTDGESSPAQPILKDCKGVRV